MDRSSVLAPARVDWQLWIERKGRMTSAKCPLRLEVESHLRAWLLRVSGLPLHTLTYTELRLITEGKIADAKRLHVRGHDTLMHRLRDGTDPISLMRLPPSTNPRAN